MLIVGEKINATRKRIGQACQERNGELIIQTVKEQPEPARFQRRLQRIGCQTGVTIDVGRVLEETLGPGIQLGGIGKVLQTQVKRYGRIARKIKPAR